MEITSTAFEDGTVIPLKYTCDGEDISPRLDVTFPPSGATTLVLIVDDPDAPVGTWDHWVEFDIPIAGDEITWEEGAAILGTPGSNSWSVTGYGGPCPPEGQDHRYFFTIYALDVELILPEGVSSDSVRVAMEGHILGEAQLMGTYAR
jgi:Raf kinase inhibitor-like YbhB/YbcL family protein